MLHVRAQFTTLGGAAQDKAREIKTMKANSDAIDVAARAESWNMRLLGHSDLAGHGDGSRVDKKGSFLYVAHMKSMGVTILNVDDPAHPRVVNQIVKAPGVHNHKLQIAGDLMITNHERAPWEKGNYRPGVQLYDVSRPDAPKEISFFPTCDKGVHRFWFADGRYAHLPTSAEGFSNRIYSIIDVQNPTRAQEVGRWWLPGLWAAGGETPGWDPNKSVWCHGIIVHGDRAYVAYEDEGMAILDISNMSSPRLVSRLDLMPPFRGHTHTVLPLPRRKLLIVAEESVRNHGADGVKMVWVVDVRDETKPVPIAAFPVPEGDFCARGGRFGPHNLHENRPGSTDDDLLIYLCYFNAGIRVVDISNPFRPEETGFFIPPAPAGQEAIQINDVYVDSDGLIYITDRVNGGLYVLEYTGPRPAQANDKARDLSGKLWGLSQPEFL
jgi:hypothetical protein